MPINILMPALSPTMEEGTLARWLLNEGDTVKSGFAIAEIETDKATMDLEAADDGILGKIVVAEGTEGVKVNELIGIILEVGESSDAIFTKSTPNPLTDAKPLAQRPTTNNEFSARDAAHGERVFASPLARRIAKEKGLALDSIKGSGPKGRVIFADLDSMTGVAESGFASSMTELLARATVTGIAENPYLNSIKEIYKGREFEEVRLDGMRNTIATRLSEAKRSIPHFYLRRNIVLDKLIDFRLSINEELKDQNIRLSINDFIVKACAQALQEVPECNAVWAGDRILRLKSSDIAVAVAVNGGILTPVINDADKKSISTISAEIKYLSSKARSRKLNPRDYEGGSFAISNLGMMEVESFDAIINPPHASILAIGSGMLKPVVSIDGKIEVSTVMSVTLSADHRMIDGVLGAVFLKKITKRLENPVVIFV